MRKATTTSKISTQAPQSKLISKDSTMSKIGDKLMNKSRPFNPLEYLYTGYHPDQIVQIRQAFDNFDADKTGQASIADIKEAFINLGFAQKNPLSLRILDYMDKKNNGLLVFKQFIDLATMQMNQKWTREQSNIIFSVYDSTGQGKFSIYDLQQLAEDLGGKWEPEKLQHMFNKADFDGDGYILEEDFHYIMIGQGKQHQKKLIKQKQIQSTKTYKKVPQKYTPQSKDAKKQPGKRY